MDEYLSYALDLESTKVVALRPRDRSSSGGVPRGAREGERARRAGPRAQGRPDRGREGDGGRALRRAGGRARRVRSGVRRLRRARVPRPRGDGRRDRAVLEPSPRHERDRASRRSTTPEESALCSSTSRRTSASRSRRSPTRRGRGSTRCSTRGSSPRTRSTRGGPGSMPIASTSRASWRSTTIRRPRRSPSPWTSRGRESPTTRGTSRSRRMCSQPRRSRSASCRTCPRRSPVTRWEGCAAPASRCSRARCRACAPSSISWTMRRPVNDRAGASPPGSPAGIEGEWRRRLAEAPDGDSRRAPALGLLYGVRHPVVRRAAQRRSLEEAEWAAELDRVSGRDEDGRCRGSRTSPTCEGSGWTSGTVEARARRTATSPSGSDLSHGRGDGAAGRRGRARHRARPHVRSAGAGRGGRRPGGAHPRPQARAPTDRRGRRPPPDRRPRDAPAPGRRPRRAAVATSTRSRTPSPASPSSPSSSAMSSPSSTSTP